MLPEDTGFVLIGLMMESLSSDPASATMPQADEEAWHRAFDAVIAGLLLGENAVVDLYKKDRRDMTAARNGGRHFFTAFVFINRRSDPPKVYWFWHR